MSLDDYKYKTKERIKASIVFGLVIIAICHVSLGCL